MGPTCSSRDVSPLRPVGVEKHQGFKNLQVVVRSETLRNCFVAKNIYLHIAVSVNVLMKFLIKMLLSQ